MNPSCIFGHDWFLRQPLGVLMCRRCQRIAPVSHHAPAAAHRSEGRTPTRGERPESLSAVPPG